MTPLGNVLWIWLFGVLMGPLARASEEVTLHPPAVVLPPPPEPDPAMLVTSAWLELEQLRRTCPEAYVAAHGSFFSREPWPTVSA